MIDTVKFSAEVSDCTLKNIKIKSREYRRYNHFEGKDELNYFSSNVNLPSYWRGVNIQYNPMYGNKVFFELSLPKFLYGHNLILIDQFEALKATRDLRNIFIKEFSEFPSVNNWLINRIDLCYTWALPDYESALSLLAIVQGFKYPRKEAANYATSAYAHSEKSTVKYYLKKDEFSTHDYRYIQRLDSSVANDLLRLSNNLFRMEVELRAKQIDAEFDNVERTPYNLFNYNKIYNILNKYLNNTMNGQALTITGTLDKYKKLLKCAKSKAQAVHLYEFYRLLHSELEEDRLYLRHTYSDSTIRRKKKLLRDFGIGLSSKDNKLFNFDFSIPSKNNVNSYLKKQDSGYAGLLAMSSFTNSRT